MDKNQNDVVFKDMYDFMGQALRPCDINNIKEYEQHEKLFYSDTFLLQSSVFEYYLKGDKIKGTDDTELTMKAIESIADGDALDGMRRDCDFSLMPFISNSAYIKPLQLVGKPKTQLFFPATVSKQNKILNNMKKISAIKLETPSVINYNFEEYMAIQKIQQINKIKKKDRLVDQTLMKHIFTINS